MVALPVRTVLRGNPPNASHQIDPLELTDLLEQIQSSAATNGALVAFRDTVAGLATVSASSGQYACVLASDDTSGIYEYDGANWSKVGPLPVIIAESAYAQQVAEIAAQFGDVAAAIEAAQAWAEGNEPGGPGTKSAKEAAQEADASAQTAEKWASEDEDVEVSGGKYSAMHYMLKSEATLTQVAAILDTFDDRFLGPLASDPATDNDGDPLVVGATYFNTTSNLMRIWNGTSWQIFGTDVSLALLKNNALSELAALGLVGTALSNLGFSADAKALVNAATYAAMRGLLGLGSGALHDVSSNPDLSVDPTLLPTRDAVAGAIDIASSTAIGSGDGYEVLTMTAGTAYQNSETRPWVVMINGYKNSGGYGAVSRSADNTTWQQLSQLGGNGAGTTVTFIVPASWYFKVEAGSTIYRSIRTY